MGSLEIAQVYLKERRVSIENCKVVTGEDKFLCYSFAGLHYAIEALVVCGTKELIGRNQLARYSGFFLSCAKITLW